MGWKPAFTAFRPATAGTAEPEEAVLSLDEFEAVRLKDLQGLEQNECAALMEISQPTFHRLVVSARRKIADALTHGKIIKIEGGNYRF